MRPFRTIAFDVDGTLTDGMYHVSAGRDVTKSFYTRDIWAIEELVKAKYNVVIISQASDLCVVHKFASMKERVGGIDIIRGASDKVLSLEALTKIRWDQLFYVGDAENDLECMKLALFTACPFDAVPIIQEESNFISMLSGGHGAVYDIATRLLKGEFDNV